MSDHQSTVVELLERRLEADPDSEYLDVCGAKVTAADVATTANRLANALADLGISRGDRVATLIENSAEAMLAWWGAIRLGAIAVPINTAYKGEYLRHQLADSGARVLIVASELADRAARVVGQVDGLAHVVVVDGEPGRTVAGATTHTWADLLEADDSPPQVDI